MPKPGQSVERYPPYVAIVEAPACLSITEGLDWDKAWGIVRKVFATSHTEALEKWPVTVLSRLLKTHGNYIYDINFFFLKDVERKFPTKEYLEQSFGD